MLTLYYFPGACSMASHAALEETGAPYELRLIGLLKGEQHEDAYRRINPRGVVPALQTEDGVLTESIAILTYLAQRFPQARLLPDSPMAAARSLAAMSWISNTLDVSYRRGALPQRFVAEEAARPAVKEAGQKAFWTNLQTLDADLIGKTWLAGEQFSVADLYALVYYGWGHRMRLPMTELAAFTALKDRLLARPAVRKVLEDEKNPLVSAP